MLNSVHISKDSIFIFSPLLEIECDWTAPILDDYLFSTGLHLGSPSIPSSNCLKIQIMIERVSSAPMNLKLTSTSISQRENGVYFCLVGRQPIGEQNKNSTKPLQTSPKLKNQFIRHFHNNSTAYHLRLFRVVWKINSV